LSILVPQTGQRIPSHFGAASEVLSRGITFLQQGVDSRIGAASAHRLSGT
jgi:hypothetical protein